MSFYNTSISLEKNIFDEVNFMPNSCPNLIIDGKS